MGGNQEDKSNLNSSGPARGHISLDQARVLAYNTPRDNRELYGRYAKRELVWDVISSDETEDIYEIRLSYRPQGNFHTARSFVNPV